MARTEIPITDVPFQEGVEITETPVDSANGMMFLNDGMTLIVLRNSNVSMDVTVTAVAVEDEAGRAVDFVLNVDSQKLGFIGPLRNAWWNQRSGVDIGKVYLDFDIDTDISIAALKVDL